MLFASLRQTLNTTLAVVFAAGLLVSPATAALSGFTVTFNANGQISGTLEDLQLVDDLQVAIEGVVELQDLAPVLLTHRVLRNDRSKMKEVWLDRLEIVGDELVVRGGARYEDRQPLPFDGWTTLFSQSGSVEIRLKVSAVNGIPSVQVTRVNVELGGLLGDVMKVFALDDSLERIARPLIEAEVNRQIAAHIPRTIGRIDTIRVDSLAFVSLGQGRYGVRMAASASIALS